MPVEIPPLHLDLTVHAPLSEARLTTVVESLLEGPAGAVADLGCGWGELLMRVVAAAPGSTGHREAGGVRDRPARVADRGRRAAGRRNGGVVA